MLVWGSSMSAAEFQAAMEPLSEEQKFGTMLVMVPFRAMNSASLALISAFLPMRPPTAESCWPNAAKEWMKVSPT